MDLINSSNEIDYLNSLPNEIWFSILEFSTTGYILPQLHVCKLFRIIIFDIIKKDSIKFNYGNDLWIFYQYKIVNLNLLEESNLNTILSNSMNKKSQWISYFKTIRKNKVLLRKQLLNLKINKETIPIFLELINRKIPIYYEHHDIIKNCSKEEYYILINIFKKGLIKLNETIVKSLLINFSEKEVIDLVIDPNTTIRHDIHKLYRNNPKVIKKINYKLLSYDINIIGYLLGEIILSLNNTTELDEYLNNNLRDIDHNYISNLLHNYDLCDKKIILHYMSKYCSMQHINIHFKEYVEMFLFNISKHQEYTYDTANFGIDVINLLLSNENYKKKLNADYLKLFLDFDLHYILNDLEKIKNDANYLLNYQKHKQNS